MKLLDENETRKLFAMLDTLKNDIVAKQKIIDRQADTIVRQGEIIRKDLERRQNQESVWKVQQSRIKELEDELHEATTCEIPAVNLHKWTDDEVGAREGSAQLVFNKIMSFAPLNQPDPKGQINDRC